MDRFRLQARRAGEATHEDRPFALLRAEAGGPRLYALSPEAVAVKLRRGMSLADARAVCPGLHLADAAPERDVQALEALALWCGRYSPWVAVDGADGVLLDITGCAHLMGGEAALLDDVAARLERLGFAVRAAAASNPDAARAWARFGESGVLAASRTEAAVRTLPIAALGLEPETTRGLERLGFKRVRDLEPVPHHALATRFGPTALERLYRLLGRMKAPFVALSPPVRHAVRLGWAEPLGTTEGIEAAIADALASLCRALDHAQLGARTLRLELARLDGALHRLEVRTARASRTPQVLLRLFREGIDGLDIGFGIECLRLAATATEPLGPIQIVSGGSDGGEARADAEARLVERLTHRLGADRVRRLRARDSHWPERAVRLVPALDPPPPVPWPARGPRPLRLLEEPRPVGALAEVPDGAPRRLHLDGRPVMVIAAEGPERIEPEWWRGGEALPRDYHRLDLENGRRLWVRREGRYGSGTPPRWTVDGVFV